MEIPESLQLSRADTTPGTVMLRSGMQLAVINLHLWGLMPDGTAAQFPPLWMTRDAATALADGIRARLQQQESDPPAPVQPEH